MQICNDNIIMLMCAVQWDDACKIQPNNNYKMFRLNLYKRIHFTTQYLYLHIVLVTLYKILFNEISYKSCICVIVCIGSL